MKNHTGTVLLETQLKTSKPKHFLKPKTNNQTSIKSVCSAPLHLNVLSDLINSESLSLFFCTCAHIYLWWHNKTEQHTSLYVAYCWSVSNVCQLQPSWQILVTSNALLFFIICICNIFIITGTNTRSIWYMKSTLSCFVEIQPYFLLLMSALYCIY